MNGIVDDAGRALISLQIRATNESEVSDLSVWVDTAFTGDLVVPRKAIERLGLTQSAAVAARLADGTEVILETYHCIVEWFGSQRVVEVVENDGQFPLLGVGLLMDKRLEVNHRSKKITVD